MLSKTLAAVIDFDWMGYTLLLSLLICFLLAIKTHEISIVHNEQELGGCVPSFTQFCVRYNVSKTNLGGSVAPQSGISVYSCSCDVWNTCTDKCQAKLLM